MCPSPLTVLKASRMLKVSRKANKVRDRMAKPAVAAVAAVVAVVASVASVVIVRLS